MHRRAQVITLSQFWANLPDLGKEDQARGAATAILLLWVWGIGINLGSHCRPGRLRATS